MKKTFEQNQIINIGMEHRRMENDSERSVVSAPQELATELRDQSSKQYKRNTLENIRQIHKLGNIREIRQKYQINTSGNIRKIS